MSDTRKIALIICDTYFDKLESIADDVQTSLIKDGAPFKNAKCTISKNRFTACTMCSIAFDLVMKGAY